jgi:hypothetical protein
LEVTAELIGLPWPKVETAFGAISIKRPCPATTDASSQVATGCLDILFANSQFRHMLEWEDPTARSDELTKAGTEP